jgi:hypothetical protein
MFTIFKRTKWNGSNSKDSGTLLAEKLGCGVLTPHSSKGPKRDNIVINWGMSTMPFYPNAIVNDSQLVAVAIDKLLTLHYLSACNVPTPDYTSNKDVALSWLEGGEKVFCRTLLRASQGKGIIIAKKPEDLVDAQLYTKNHPKNMEFRVHLVLSDDHKFSHVQHKRRLTTNSLNERGISERSQYIRNLSNGWIYSDNKALSEEEEELLVEVATNAIKTLPLDFGAVDIMLNKDGKFRVLEVNTAPGLHKESTLNFYADSFKTIGEYYV